MIAPPGPTRTRLSVGLGLRAFAAQANILKLAAALTAAVAVLALGRPALAAEVPAPLSAADIKLYSQAYEAAEKGDFTVMDERLAKVSDPTLAGDLDYARLMHPRHSATYAELTTWLKEHGDEAGADRIHALAVRRKPSGVATPRAPLFVAALAAADKPTASPKAAAAKGKGRKVNSAQAARDAYYSGDVRRALTLATAAGERWIAGLAAFRLARPADAFGYFRAVADNPSEDPWLRSAAAFWAARSGGVAGVPDATDYLRVAAQAPHTFYGMIAERQLALQGTAVAAGLQPALNLGSDPIADLITRASLRTPVAAAATPPLPTDARAHRAEALFQLGHKDEARAEAKIGMALAKTESARERWQALADAFSPPAAKPATFARASATQSLIPPLKTSPVSLPAPDLTPLGGFTIDKAMVYALVRQESAFNPLAQSGAAVGGRLVRLGGAGAAKSLRGVGGALGDRRHAARSQRDRAVHRWAMAVVAQRNCRPRGVATLGERRIRL